MEESVIRQLFDDVKSGAVSTDHAVEQIKITLLLKPLEISRGLITNELYGAGFPKLF